MSTAISQINELIASKSEIDEKVKQADRQEMEHRIKLGADIAKEYMLGYLSQDVIDELFTDPHFEYHASVSKFETFCIFDKGVGLLSPWRVTVGFRVAHSNPDVSFSEDYTNQSHTMVRDPDENSKFEFAKMLERCRGLFEKWYFNLAIEKEADAWRILNNQWGGFDHGAAAKAVNTLMAKYPLMAERWYAKHIVWIENEKQYRRTLAEKAADEQTQDTLEKQYRTEFQAFTRVLREVKEANKKRGIELQADFLPAIFYRLTVYPYSQPNSYQSDDFRIFYWSVSDKPEKGAWWPLLERGGMIVPTKLLGVVSVSQYEITMESDQDVLQTVCSWYHFQGELIYIPVTYQFKDNGIMETYIEYLRRQFVEPPQQPEPPENLQTSRACKVERESRPDGDSDVPF